MTLKKQRQYWFAQNLRALRALEDSSLEKVAYEVCISAKALAYIENSKTMSPGVHVLGALADYFCVPLCDFIEKDLSDLSIVDSVAEFMREDMTEVELVQTVGALKAAREAKRKARFYVRPDLKNGRG